MNAYESAQREYFRLLEESRGKIKPFAMWLEEMKRKGYYWEHPKA